MSVWLACSLIPPIPRRLATPAGNDVVQFATDNLTTRDGKRERERGSG